VVFQNVRALVRIETALVAVILAAAVAGAYLYLERADAQKQVEELNRQVNTTMANTESYRVDTGPTADELTRKTQELALKREELAQEEEALKPQGLPSRREALDLSTQLTSYVAEHGLGLGNFRTDPKASVTIGDTKFPAVNYAMITFGSTESLIGVLDTVGNVSTVRVNKLELARNLEVESRWILDLNITVVFNEEG